MATVKSYTDIEQSKKLAEILPLESADMYYMETSCNDYTISMLQRMERDMLLKQAEYYKMFACWSLAALLGVLPYCPDLGKHTDGKWYITTYPNDVHTCLMAYDNPVDACVAMIERLNELKML